MNKTTAFSMDIFPKIDLYLSMKHGYMQICMAKDTDDERR